MKAAPLLLGVLGVGLACGANGSTTDGTRKSSTALEAPAPTPMAVELPSATRSDGTPSLAPLVKSLAPAVVNLEVVKETTLPDDHPFRQFFGDPAPQQGAGSGFIISADGYILTNNHVVSDATEVTVRFADESTVQGKVIGSDPRTDVALVKVENADKKAFPFVELGSSSGIEVGDWVIAIGNPFGLNHTVTAGIVSAKGRQIGAGIYDDFIQTDASINPGNSGGPLFDLHGKVVGINTAVNAYGQGIAYAVPVDLIKDRIEELKTSGTIARGWLGVSLQPADDTLLESLKIPKGEDGALVSEAYDDMPAAKSGVQDGDFIVSVGGTDVKNTDELRMRIGQFRPGDKVAVDLYRDGKKETLEVELGLRPEEDQVSGMSTPREPRGRSDDEGKDEGRQASGALGRIGIEVAELSLLKNEYGMRIPNDVMGVVVTSVKDDSPAAGKLEPRDIIVEVNEHPVKNAAEVSEALQKGKDPALFIVLRNGGRTFVAVPLKD